MAQHLLYHVQNPTIQKEIQLQMQVMFLCMQEAQIQPAISKEYKF